MVDTYRFHVKGHLDDRWSDCLGGLAVQRQDEGTTVLVGPVADQVALHGLIIRIRDLGLPMLSVSLVDKSHSNISQGTAGSEPCSPHKGDHIMELTIGY